MFNVYCLLFAVCLKIAEQKYNIYRKGTLKQRFNINTVMLEKKLRGENY